MKIAIDIDDVLFEFIREYFDFARRKGYKDIVFEDVHTYDLWKLLGTSRDEAFTLADEFYDSEFFDNGKIIEGSKRALELLKNHELFFITSRPISLRDKTYSFLNRNFGVEKDQVFFAGDVIEGQGKTKEYICEDLGVKLIIDDRGDYCLNYANHGINVLLPDKPWNKGFEHDLITRCDGWKDILENIWRFVDEE